MKARPTAAQWLGLAFGVALLVGVLAVRQRDHLLCLGEDAELIRLRVERQRLSAYDPGKMRALEKAADSLDEQLRSLERSPEGWTVEAAHPQEGSSAVSWKIAPQRTITWSGLVDTITTLTSVPGIRVVSIDIRSRGTRSKREIAAVEILLEQPTATPSRRKPSSGTGSPGAEARATSPAVGLGPSLRRPAASAEPPASGQDSASVRPDPRGPWAGSFSTVNPQPKQP